MKTLLLTLAAAIAVVCPVALGHGPNQPPHQIAELGEFQLEGGGVIKNLRMSYVTHGTLNPARDNAILFMHGFAANHHTADHLIGPGKAFDTDKYFVIASDSFGSTQTGFEHSTSATNSGLKMNFPPYNGQDMINAEHKLVTAGLGINHLVAVAGISMGGYKSLQFAVSYPDFMDATIPIVGGGLWSSMSFLSDLLLRSAIENCAGWEDGNYDENPRKCAADALTGIIPQFYTRDWWDENVVSDEDFETWHKRVWDAYIGVQDARDLYLMSTAFMAVADTPGFKGDLAAALGAIKAKVLFIISPHDQFLSAEMIEKQDAMILDSRILSIDRNTGHMICCGEDPVATEIMTKEIPLFLDALGLVQAASGQQARAGGAIPDLSGIWEAPNELNSVYKNTSVCGEPTCAKLEGTPSALRLVTTIEEPQMLPWAEERYKASREDGSQRSRQDADPWFSACWPASPAWLTLSPFVAVEIRQFPDIVLLLFGGTAGDADHDVRRVYVDGRGHPSGVEPTWKGHSIGRYDGDTLLVDTISMKGDRWIDFQGHPHSDALHLVERIRRVDQNSLEFEVTIDDPKAYSNAWAKKIVRELAAPGPRVWEEVNCEGLLQMGTHYGAAIPLE